MLKMLESINVAVKEEELLRLLGCRKHAPLGSKIERIFETEIREGYRLAEPKAIYTKVGAREIDSSITLDNDLILHTSGTMRPWKSFEYVVMVLCTIGSALERRVAELFDRENFASAVVLDSVGSVAVGNVADLVYQFICHCEEEHGVEVSPRLGPGYGEWSLSDQGTLFTILPAAKIGIKLNEQYMMTPRKSISFCVAAGKELDGKTVVPPCQCCGMGDCKYRRVD